MSPSYSLYDLFAFGTLFYLYGISVALRQQSLSRTGLCFLAGIAWPATWLIAAFVLCKQVSRTSSPSSTRQV